MAGDFLTCDNQDLSGLDLFRLLLEDDGAGCPMLRVSSSITSITQKDSEVKFAEDSGASGKFLAAIKFDSTGGFDSVSYFNLDLTPYVPVGTMSILDDDEAAILDFAAKTGASLVPEAHDYIALTYVAAGDGIGEISTVTYKDGGAGGTTVATLTLTYDTSDRLADVTRS